MKFPCIRDDPDPVMLILTSTMGFTAEEEDKVRQYLRRASWGLTTVTVSRHGKNIECTFPSAKRRKVERLYNDVKGKLAEDFIGPWSTTIVG